MKRSTQINIGLTVLSIVGTFIAVPYKPMPTTQKPALPAPVNTAAIDRYYAEKEHLDRWWEKSNRSIEAADEYRVRLEEMINRSNRAK